MTLDIVGLQLKITEPRLYILLERHERRMLQSFD